MRRILSISFMLLSLSGAMAHQEVICISLDGVNQYAALTAIDSIYFDAEGETLYVQPVGNASPLGIARTAISGITYLPSRESPTKLKVAYDGNTATIDNPYFLSGVTVDTDGGYVTITNPDTTTEIETELSGETQDGGYTYVGSYKTTLVLNGVSITSRRGAAIDIQDGKRVALELKKGSVNTLSDCAGGTQKAALYCKGHLEIDKSGTLTVTGNTAHAISAKEYLKLKKSDGTINILGAVKDGMHCKQYFVGNGFTVNISGVGDDCIQCELDDDDDATAATLIDGFLNGTLIINDGIYTLSNSTNGWVEDNDTKTAKGLSADGDMQLNGGIISITMTGTGGKGIKVEGAYTQGLSDGTGPQLTIATTGAPYTPSGGSWAPAAGGGGGHPGGPGGEPGGPGGESSGSGSKAIKVMGTATILGGTTIVTTATSGAEGLESKTSILIKGGTHYFRCYDDCINSAGIIDFAGGNTVCYSTNNDAVDSNYGRSGAITISGGNVFAYTKAGSPEEGLDCDNNAYIKITGGIAVSAGGSQGGGGGSSSSSQSVGSSSQGYYLGSSPSNYSTSYYYTLYNTAGKALCTYLFESGISNSLSLLTAPDLGKGSVRVKAGTQAPTDCASKVTNPSGTDVFFIAPTVVTTTTTATVTAR